MRLNLFRESTRGPISLQVHRLPGDPGIALNGFQVEIHLFRVVVGVPKTIF